MCNEGREVVFSTMKNQPYRGGGGFIRIFTFTIFAVFKVLPQVHTAGESVPAKVIVPSREAVAQCDSML